jgi:hypothetical protein
VARYTASDFVQNRDCRTDLTGRAIPALVTIVPEERGLHRVKVLRRTKTFNSCNLISLMLHSEAETGVDARTIHQDSAGTTLALITAFLRAC